MKPLILSAVVAVAITAPFAHTATAHNTEIAPAHRSAASSPVHFHPAAGGSCYKQLDNEAPVGITSQNFEPGFEAYDDRGADDFTLARRCTITTVEVAGTYFSGSGVADSLDVKFYADGGGTPGALLEHRRKLGYTDRTGYGGFSIPLAAPVTLMAGTYWVSVRSNQSFGTSGQWGWVTNESTHGTPAQWKNPGDGFGTGCTTYQDMIGCFMDIGQGPDFMFALLK